jgi:hypothetical protein
MAVLIKALNLEQAKTASEDAGVDIDELDDDI